MARRKVKIIKRAAKAKEEVEGDKPAETVGQRRRKKLYGGK